MSRKEGRTIPLIGEAFSDDCRHRKALGTNPLLHCSGEVPSRLQMQLCHRHTFFTENKYKHLNASCEVGCATYSLLCKSNVRSTCIEIFTSLAKIGMRDP